MDKIIEDWLMRITHEDENNLKQQHNHIGVNSVPITDLQKLALELALEHKIEIKCVYSIDACDFDKVFYPKKIIGLSFLNSPNIYLKHCFLSKDIQRPCYTSKNPVPKHIVNFISNTICSSKEVTYYMLLHEIAHKVYNHRQPGLTKDGSDRFDKGRF